jgi:Domain of unknown function (DUF4440)
MTNRVKCKYFLALSFLISTIKCEAQKANVLKKIEAKRYALMIAEDTAGLSKMLAPSLQYYHSNGMLDSKTSLLNSIATKELKHKNITITNATYRIYRKNFGIVTGRCTYDINYKSYDMVLDFVFTNVYYKNKGKWLLVSRQTTKL